MEELPPPPLPSDVDLRDYPYMPVDISRLFGSEFHAMSDDTSWRAGFTLWLKSYHQVPASSIPDDDIALARLAEFGRDVKAWKRVKAAALRGWRKCNDGRLYHPVVAEKALEGWLEKLNQRKSSAAGNAARHKIPFDAGAFDAAIQDCRHRLALLNPHSRVLAKRIPKVTSGTPDGTIIGIPDDAPDRTKNPPDGRPNGTPAGNPEDVPSGSQVKEREGNIPPSPPSGARPPRGVDPARGSRIDPSWQPSDDDIATAHAEGLNDQQIQYEIDKFRDYWLAKAGKEGRKADWHATWRNWVRNSKPSAMNGHARAGPPQAETLFSRPTRGAESAMAGMAAVLNAREKP